MVKDNPDKGKIVYNPSSQQAFLTAGPQSGLTFLVHTTPQMKIYPYQKPDSFYLRIILYLILRN